jgi:hypothetical protein
MNLFDVGGLFEYDWMTYIQSQGYFVRQAIPITSDSNVEDATDIDIWGVRFLPPLRRSTAVVDCKNKTRSKPYERILWAKGMAVYVGADQVFVGVPKANWKAIDFAHQVGISLIPYDVIGAHVSRLPSGREGYGQASFSLYRDFFPSKKKAFRADKNLSEQMFEARSYYRLGSPFTNLNRIVERLQFCSQQLGYTSEDQARHSLWLFTTCELIAAFAVNLMRAAEGSFFLAPVDRRGLLVKRLTYGDMPADKADEIIKLSSGLAWAYAQEALPMEVRAKLPAGPVDQISLPAPDYAGEIAEILERVVAQPMMYWEAVRLLDAILFGNMVFGRPVQSGDLPRPEGSADPADIYKAAKNLIVLACDAAGIDRRPFWPERSVAPSGVPTVSAEVPTDNHAVPAPEATEPAPAEAPEGSAPPTEK